MVVTRELITLMIFYLNIAVSWDRMKDETYERGDSVYVVQGDSIFTINGLRVRNPTPDYIECSDGKVYKRSRCFVDRVYADMFIEEKTKQLRGKK